MPDSMDWVKSDMRSCDSCGRETDAGEWPDWPNGICEDCDPEILFTFYDCEECHITESIDDAKIIRGNDLIQTRLLCSVCFADYKENSNA